TVVVGKLELHFLERDAGLPQQHPGPHGPGGVVLVADDEFQLKRHFETADERRSTPMNAQLETTLNRAFPFPHRISDPANRRQDLPAKLDVIGVYRSSSAVRSY